MGRQLASLAAGLLFGFGLALSGMTHPQKVLGFLDVAGPWDASLLFVLGGAVGVTLLSFRFILRMGKPLLAERFVITRETHIDRPMLVGAALFGVGWGISGYCPGPAIALLAAPNWELLAFLPAAILGAVAEKYFELRAQKKRAMQAQAAQPQGKPAAQDGKPESESPSEGSCG
jgi:uncharacterized membrane protein YedE/YeeE